MCGLSSTRSRPPGHELAEEGELIETPCSARYAAKAEPMREMMNTMKR